MRCPRSSRLEEETSRQKGVPSRKSSSTWPPGRQAARCLQGAVSVRSPLAPALGRKPMEERVTFVSHGLKLAGVLHIPDEMAPGERRPACLVLHGFGSNKGSKAVISPA